MQLGQRFATQVAVSTPFDNSTDGFLSNNTQAAIEEALASAGGLQPNISSGLIMSYKSGRVWVNGVLFTFAAGTITLGASLTNNFVYVSTAGAISSGATIPANAIPIAQFTTSASAITTLTDIRGSLNNAVIFALSTDLSTNLVGNAQTVGTTNRFAMADHVHPTQLTTFTVASTSNTTTTSATQVALNAMTITPGVAGTFWGTFNTSVQSTAGGNSITMGMYANGALQGETQTVQFPTATLIDTGYPFFIGLHFPTLVVTAAQAITIEWSTNGGTATCLNRRLSLLRIA